VATVIFCCPFILYYIISRYLPIFEDPAEGAYESGVEPETEIPMEASTDE